MPFAPRALRGFGSKVLTLLQRKTKGAWKTQARGKHTIATASASSVLPLFFFFLFFVPCEDFLVFLSGLLLFLGILGVRWG